MATRLGAWASARREPHGQTLTVTSLVKGGQPISNLRDTGLRHDFTYTHKTIVKWVEMPKTGIRELGNAKIGPYQAGEIPNLTGCDGSSQHSRLHIPIASKTEILGFVFELLLDEAAKGGERGTSRAVRARKAPALSPCHKIEL